MAARSGRWRSAWHQARAVRAHQRPPAGTPARRALFWCGVLLLTVYLVAFSDERLPGHERARRDRALRYRTFIQCVVRTGTNNHLWNGMAAPEAKGPSSSMVEEASPGIEPSPAE
ncbi:hypothetical protein JW905_15325 [bacterium]|nr:hypothetical protein [candidate division CSSED10-310 bacterium]